MVFSFGNNVTIWLCRGSSTLLTHTSPGVCFTPLLLMKSGKTLSSMKKRQEQDDSISSMQFLMGFNESYSAVQVMVICDNRSSASNNSERKPLHCTHCDMDHHTIDIWHKLHGYPLGTYFTSLVQLLVRTSAKLLENGVVVVLPIMPLLAVVLLCKILVRRPVQENSLDGE
ncbi:unnamed protein product [Prunus brigantina]